MRTLRTVFSHVGMGAAFILSGCSAPDVLSVDVTPSISQALSSDNPFFEENPFVDDIDDLSALEDELEREEGPFTEAQPLPSSDALAEGDREGCHKGGHGRPPMRPIDSIEGIESASIAIDSVVVVDKDRNETETAVEPFVIDPLAEGELELDLDVNVDEEAGRMLLLKLADSGSEVIFDDGRVVPLKAKHGAIALPRAMGEQQLAIVFGVGRPLVESEVEGEKPTPVSEEDLEALGEDDSIFLPVRAHAKGLGGGLEGLGILGQKPGGEGGKGHGGKGSKGEGAGQAGAPQTPQGE